MTAQLDLSLTVKVTPNLLRWAYEHSQPEVRRRETFEQCMNCDIMRAALTLQVKGAFRKGVKISEQHH